MIKKNRIVRGCMSFIIGISIAISGLHINVSECVQAKCPKERMFEKNDEIKEAINDMEGSLDAIKQEVVSEIVEEIVEDNQSSKEINDGKVLQIQDEMTDNGNVNNSINELLYEMDDVTECNEIVKELEEIKLINSVEDFDNIRLLDSETGKNVESVEDAYSYILRNGYNIDKEFVDICENIMVLKAGSEDDSLTSIVGCVDQTCAENLNSEGLISFGSKVEASSRIQESYKQWTKLTTQEKLLIAGNPVAAMLTKSMSETAYKWTKKSMGIMGGGCIRWL